MNTKFVKQKQTVANCLSNCIISHLNKDGYHFSENDLYCNENMLTIHLNKSSHYLTVPIEKSIMQDIKKIGMKLCEVKEPNINKLDYLLNNKKRIILCIDSKNLYYSETYTKTPTSLGNHFINVFTGSQGYYSVYDGYIPTIPISNYIGDIHLTESAIQNSIIYTLEYDDLIENDNDYKLESMLLSLKNYKTSINESNPFQSLSQELITGNLNSTTLFEIAVSLVAEGVFSTRILFFNAAKNLVNLNEDIIKKYYNLHDIYFALRLSLIKYSFTKSEKDLETVIKNIEKIEVTENYLFSQIENLLKEKYNGAIFSDKNIHLGG